MQWGLMPAWQVGFEQMLPEIEDQARHAFSGVGPKRLERLVAEVIARAFAVYISLAQRGKAEIVDAKPLATSAIKQVRKTSHIHPSRRF
jgi:hypothetical protein